MLQRSPGTSYLPRILSLARHPGKRLPKPPCSALHVRAKPEITGNALRSFCRAGKVEQPLEKLCRGCYNYPIIPATLLPEVFLSTTLPT